MDRKCTLPTNIVKIDGKTFLLPNFNPKLISAAGSKKADPIEDVSKNYRDELECKVNLDALKLQAQQSSKSQKQEKFSYKGDRKDEFTHFISIPLLEVKDKIYALHDEIQNQTEKNLEKHFQDPCLTHLTMCMLSLDSEEAQKAAVKVLEENAKEIKYILSETTLQLKGLGFFPHFSNKKGRGNESKKARIVYLKMENNAAYQALERLLDFLVKKFLQAQVLRENQLSHIWWDNATNTYKGDNFHITLMRDKGGFGIEVGSIMETLGNFHIGNTEISTVDLSTRFEYDEDNFYLPLHRIHLKK